MVISQLCVSSFFLIPCNFWCWLCPQFGFFQNHQMFVTGNWGCIISFFIPRGNKILFPTTIKKQLNISSDQITLKFKHSVQGLFPSPISLHFSSVQLLSRVQLFVTPWTTAQQASLSIIKFRSLPKLMSIEAVITFNRLILCCLLLLLPAIFPSIRVFSNESVLHISGQSIGVSASTSVLPTNTQD